MIIQDSNVSMASSRSYRQGGTVTRSSGSGDPTLASGMNRLLNTRKAGDTFTLSGQKESDYLSPGYTGSGLLVDADCGYPTPAEMFRLRANMVSSAVDRIRTSMMGGAFTTSSYYEEETTSFSATGQIQTADGRSIDFNIELTMTRTFMQETRISLPSLYGAFLDPLVINTDSPISRMSDQKFLFDLDADGTEEYITMPKKGTGFLSIDKNGDGVINDGNELFGAISGDGFGDLREYDSDGNGWIDENDDVFNKLKVWYKDDNGKDVLMDLKEADIGAIFLGEAATDFTLMGSNMTADAIIRSTGFFLKESGGTGTIQHVDLASETPEERMIHLMEDMLSSMRNVTTETTSTTTVNASGINFMSQGASSSTTTDKTSVTNNSDKKTDEALRNFDRIQLRKRMEQAKLKKRAEERHLERKEMLEAELERLREKRSEEEARLEALFGETHHENPSEDGVVIPEVDENTENEVAEFTVEEQIAV